MKQLLTDNQIIELYLWVCHEFKSVSWISSPLSVKIINVDIKMLTFIVYINHKMKTPQ